MIHFNAMAQWLNLDANEFVTLRADYLEYITRMCVYMQKHLLNQNTVQVYGALPFPVFAHIWFRLKYNSCHIFMPKHYTLYEHNIEIEQNLGT